ncbi:MAG: hypothetical protein ACI31G_00335, partial [Bacilli bacterium]
MKKSKLLSLSGVLFTALVLTSCNSTNSQKDYVPFSGDPTQITAKVTFWHTMGQANQETLNRMITEFNKVYPNTTIEHAAQG